MAAKIIIPLPNKDFDPSEVAIPWQLLKNAGFMVLFATPNGKASSADTMMLSGEGLDFWGWVPYLKKIRLIGLLLRANSDARAAYKNLIQDENFKNPCQYADLEIANYDGLVLPGGHAQGIKPYLEDKVLRCFVADFFEDKSVKNTDKILQHKPIAAICHGVLVASRAISPSTNKSVLYEKKTTALTWALESTAWNLTKYFARFWDKNYYRTYRESPQESRGFWSVEQEIKRALKYPNNFLDVSKNATHYFL